MPVLLLEASEESQVNPESLAEMKQIRPGMRHVKMVGTDHGIHKTDPAGFASEVLQFLEAKPLKD